MTGMARTETTGLHRLRAWMSEDPKRTKARLARQLGVSGASVHAWFDGTSRPEAPMRRAITELTGIAEEDWWTAADRALLDKARKGIAETENVASVAVDRPTGT